ncbi:hypothetical protein BH23GEM7_BH23GEM7_03620 [soil metagenome]
MNSRPLVSVVVPIFNAENFLRETVESVLGQSYERWELLLVDDGSTDASPRIAQEYQRRFADKVRYLEHPGHQNRGACASRNLGIHYARGELIAPLDADDLWLPQKLERQVALLETHPEASMVYGRPFYWSSWQGEAAAEEGDYLSQYGLPLNQLIRPPTALLRSHPLAPGGGAACPSDLLFRRRMLEETGGFEESFTGIYQLYEDQVFLAKVYLSQNICVADECWTYYRLNNPNSCMTTVHQAGQQDTARRRYLDWLEAYVSERNVTDPEIWKALNRALEPFRRPTRHRLRTYFHNGVQRSRWLAGGAARRIAEVLPSPVVRGIRTVLGRDPGEPRVGKVRFGDLRRTSPINRHWGLERGQPVDRYYIQRFLARHAQEIRGRVLEVGDDSYTRRFGGERVTQRDVLDVRAGNPLATVVADLSDADHVPSDSFDCIILTQTLQYLFDLRRAVETLHRILRPGGVLLLTVPGISQTTDENWRDSWYWSFTTPSLTRLAGEVFPEGSFEVESHGNVLAATAFLHGLASQELRAEELSAHDLDFPVLLTLRARKPER